MPLPETRLESLQIRKLIQCVRRRDADQVEKLVVNGVPELVDYTDPGEGEVPLSVAAIRDDREMVELLLRLGARPDAVDARGRTPVMRAARAGSCACVELLAKRKANMRIRDGEGKGVLFYCMQGGDQQHLQCAQLAIGHGADVDSCDDGGTPLLVDACERAADLSSFCLLLINNGADPNSEDQKTKRTALMAAASAGSKSVVKALIEKGAEVNRVMNVSKIHAVHEAAKGGYIQVLQMLSGAGAQFDVLTDHKYSALHFSAKGGHSMCCRFLAQRGCDPTLKNDHGHTARMISKKGEEEKEEEDEGEDGDEGKKSTVRELRRAERSFAKQGNGSRRTMIRLYDFCCLRSEQLLSRFRALDFDESGLVGAEDLVGVLREFRAPLPADGKDLETLVSAHRRRGPGPDVDYALFLSGRKIVTRSFRMSAFKKNKKKKSRKKKNRKKRGKKGKTKIPLPICTLHDAERKDNVGPPGAFVERHIQLVSNGEDPLPPPRKHPLQDDSRWYCQAGVRTFVNLNDAVRHWDVETIECAMKTGSEIVHWRDRFYKTPLMAAANEGHLGLVTYLIEKGADVNATDNFRWTALHFACRRGHLEVVELLLRHGAKVNAVTLNGGTPVMRAIESGVPDVVRLLIDNGAELRVETRKGKSSLDLAVAFGDPRVYEAVKSKWVTLPPLKTDKPKGKAKQSPTINKTKAL